MGLWIIFDTENFTKGTWGRGNDQLWGGTWCPPPWRHHWLDASVIGRPLPVTPGPPTRAPTDADHESKKWVSEIAETAYVKWSYPYVVWWISFNFRLKLAQKHGEGIHPHAKPENRPTSYYNSWYMYANNCTNTLQLWKWWSYSIQLFIYIITNSIPQVLQIN